MKKKFFHIFENHGQVFGIRLMDYKNKEDIDKYFVLFYDCFGYREALDRAWFDWYYQGNPYGNVNNYLLFETQTNLLIGAYGFAKCPYIFESKMIIGGLGVNGFIANNFGRRGLYSILIEKSLKEENYKNRIAFSFPHGNNIGSIKGHHNSKWILKETLPFYAKYISKSNLLKTKISAKKIKIEELIKFPFELFREENGLMFFKSFEWLVWRYQNRPHKQYIFIANFENNSVINGYLILGFYKNSSGSIRCQIIDYLAYNNESLSSLLKCAEMESKKQEADILDLIINNYSTDLAILQKHNFQSTMESYELFVYSDISLCENVRINALLGDFDAV